MLTKISFLFIAFTVRRFAIDVIFLYYQYQGVLNWFLQLFVLDLFVFDVLVYCFYICFENRDNIYHSYEVIESSFFVIIKNLGSYFMSYLVIFFDNCLSQIFGDLVCCLNNLVIFCFDIVACFPIVGLVSISIVR